MGPRECLGCPYPTGRAPKPRREGFRTGCRGGSLRAARPARTEMTRTQSTVDATCRRSPRRVAVSLMLIALLAQGAAAVPLATRPARLAAPAGGRAQELPLE